MHKIEQLLSAIDEYNNNDPNIVSIDGVETAKELVYGRRMSYQLLQYIADPSEELVIAARAQHIGRWEIPRSNYPVGKVGYFQWRTSLYKYHGDRVGDLMEALHFERAKIERVKLLISKKKLRTDVETQLLEDVICQVFFKDYALDFASKHSEEKVLDIVEKTVNKMSERGKAFLIDMEGIPVEVKKVITASIRKSD